MGCRTLFLATESSRIPEHGRSASRQAAPGRGSFGGGRRCASTALRCSLRGRPRQLTTLTSFASFRQALGSQLTSALRAPAPKLRSSPPPKSPLPDAARRDNHHLCLFGEAHPPVSEGAPGCVAPRLGGVEQRRACGRARSALRQLTSERLSERSDRRSRSELATRPRARAAQSSHREAMTASVARRSPPGRAFVLRRLQESPTRAWRTD